MQTIQIDFAKPHPTVSSIWSLIAFALVLLLAFFLWQHQQRLSESIHQLETKIEKNKAPNRISLKPGLDESIQLAHQLEQSLNVDWLGVLSALEMAQAKHSTVKLLQIRPNANRKQISLVGMATPFKTISDYMLTLEQQPAFSHVVLKQQSNSTKEAGYIQFQLDMEWR